MSARSTERARRVSASARRTAAPVAVIAAALAAVLWAAPASALPPGGAGSDTPGTSSSVSPTTLQPCQTISYTVSGFPAGETVYVKIDDGVGYGDTSVQGSGVVAQQAIPASGTVNGSFELPCAITPGAHWLRFLASKPVDSSNPGAGALGYTNRGGSDFTVVAGTGTGAAPGSGASGGGLGAAAPAAGTTVGSGSAQVGGAGGTLSIDPGAVPSETAAAPAPTASPAATAATPAPTTIAAAAPAAAASVPWIGISGLVALLVVGAVAAWLLLRRRAAP